MSTAMTAEPSRPPGAVPVAMDECATVIATLKATVGDLRTALRVVLADSPTACPEDEKRDGNVCSHANAIEDFTHDIRGAVSDLNLIQKDLQL